jgi:hypothetical protein
MVKQELSLKKDARRSTNIIFFYEQYFTEITYSKHIGFIGFDKTCKTLHLT